MSFASPNIAKHDMWSREGEEVATAGYLDRQNIKKVHFILFGFYFVQNARPS